MIDPNTPPRGALIEPQRGGVLGILGVQPKDMWKLTPATMATYLTNGEWSPAEHLLHISKIVATAIYNGLVHKKPSRIIINVPPRHGKSQMLSIHTPVWILEHWPWANIILASYGSDLSNDFSLATRDLILGNEDKLSIRLRKDRRQIDRWMTEQGGGMFAVGIGGPITGRGANVLLIDDYVKNADEAASKAKRKSNYDWFLSTASTRLEPGAPAIVVATRWHPDDVVGRLENEVESDIPWQVIKLPALASSNDPLGREPGEPLWPERYSKAALHNIRSTIGSYFWRALYQQDPVESRTGLFSGDDLQVVDILPAESRLRRIRAWDLAATEPESGSDPDYTCGLNLAYDEVTKTYIITDVVRKQLSPSNTEELTKTTASSDGPNVVIHLEQEPGSAGKNIISMFAKHTLQGYIVKGTRITGKKFTRAQPVLAAVENGTVKMLRAPWNKALRDEIDAFPDGAHDDQIDALSLAYFGHSVWNRGGATFGRKKPEKTGVSMYNQGPVWGRTSGGT